MKYIDNFLSALYNQHTKYIEPDEVEGRSSLCGEKNRWSNLKKEPFFRETFRYKRPFMDGTLESAWLNAKAAVEVMLSGKDTEDIQAGIAIIILLCCISFF